MIPRDPLSNLSDCQSALLLTGSDPRPGYPTLYCARRGSR